MGHLQIKNQGTHPKNTKENCGRKQTWEKVVLSWHLAGEKEENH
jgi:hypothetical protein